MISALVCKLSGGIREYQLVSSGCESVLRSITHYIGYLVFLPRWVGFRDGILPSAGRQKRLGSVS